MGMNRAISRAHGREQQHNAQERRQPDAHSQQRKIVEQGLPKAAHELCHQAGLLRQDQVRHVQAQADENAGRVQHDQESIGQRDGAAAGFLPFAQSLSHVSQRQNGKDWDESDDDAGQVLHGRLLDGSGWWRCGRPGVPQGRNADSGHSSTLCRPTRNRSHWLSAISSPYSRHEPQAADGARTRSTPIQVICADSFFVFRLPRVKRAFVVLAQILLALAVSVPSTVIPIRRAHPCWRVLRQALGWHSRHVESLFPAGQIEFRFPSRASPKSLCFAAASRVRTQSSPGPEAVRRQFLY